MKNIAIIYWSKTGNTEEMAKAIENGAKKAGASVDLYKSEEFNSSLVEKYDALAFGCSAFGKEELEPASFQPMWNQVKTLLNDKSVVLFGSYGWGSGEWLRNWENETSAKTITTYMANGKPNEEAIMDCESLGSKLI